MGVKVRKWGQDWYVVHHFGGRRETKKYDTKSQADKQARRLQHEISRNGFSFGKGHRSAPVFSKPFDDSNCSFVYKIHKFGTSYSIKEHGDKLDYRQFIMPRNSFIYVIQAINGLIKIGVTASIGKRFSALEASSPLPLDLVFCADTNPELEVVLHQHFKNRRDHGEWFDVEFWDVIRSALKYLDKGSL